MSTEYFVVKPEKKELFYLGKRISCFDGMATWLHKPQKAEYVKWECFDDLFLDLYENNRYFFEGVDDVPLREIWDFCYALYEWCDSPVYLDNDCNDDNTEWREWKETESVYDYIKTTLHGEELIEEIVISDIPEEYWIVKDHVLYGTESLKNFIRKVKEEIKKK